MVPGNAVARPEPGHLPPRVLAEPQEDPGGVRARHRGRDGQLDSRAPERVVAHLLDHRHSLAAHPDRGQHRVGAQRGGRALGDADQRLLAGPHVPVPGPRAEPAEEMAEHGLLESGPGALVGPPLPEILGLRRPRSQTFHRVIERPAERSLPDHVAAVSRHPPGHVGPARQHRQQAAVLEDHDAVALLEPQRPQRPRLGHGPAVRVLGVRRGHHRGLAGVQPVQVGRRGSRHMVGDPRGRDRGGRRVQVGGGGHAITLHDQAPARVGTLVFQQDRRPAPGGYPGLAGPAAQCRHGKKSTELPQVSNVIRVDRYWFAAA